MNAFWTGFEKRAALGAMIGGLANRVAQSGVGRAVAGGVQRAGSTMVGGLPLRSQVANAASTVGRVTGVTPMRQGLRQVGKLTGSGAIDATGKLVNPAMQGSAAAAHQNLLTGAKRLAGTGAVMGAGAYLMGRQPAQPAQQPPAAMPAYQ